MPTTEQSQTLSDAYTQAQDPEFFLGLFGEALDATGDWDRAVQLASDYDAAHNAPTGPDEGDAGLKAVSDALAADEHGERPLHPDEYRDADAWWGAVDPDLVVEDEPVKEKAQPAVANAAPPLDTLTAYDHYRRLAKNILGTKEGP